MEQIDVKGLVETFKAYRDMLTPIQENLNEFVETYGYVKENIDSLNEAFGGETKEKLEGIYKTLSVQAERATDLSSRIEKFAQTAGKYTSEVNQLVTLMARIEERLNTVNALESKAEAQIGRLDNIIDEKNRNYNVKDLQRSMDIYNTNVQKVSEFINKDVAETLSQSQKKLESIRGGIDVLSTQQKSDASNLEKILEAYQSSNALLKKIAESGDVNEAYVFDVLDKWATSRKVKTKR